MPVVFDMHLPCHIVKSCAIAQPCRVFNSALTAAQFSVGFNSHLPLPLALIQRVKLNEMLLKLLKTRLSKRRLESWLSDGMRECRGVRRVDKCLSRC